MLPKLYLTVVICLVSRATPSYHCKRERVWWTRVQRVVLLECNDCIFNYLLRRVLSTTFSRRQSFNISAHERVLAQKIDNKTEGVNLSIEASAIALWQDQSSSFSSTCTRSQAFTTCAIFYEALGQWRNVTWSTCRVLIGRDNTLSQNSLYVCLPDPLSRSDKKVWPTRLVICRDCL